MPGSPILCADDAHRHSLLDQRTGRQIHAVAERADAQRRVAGHRAADLDLLQAHRFDLAGNVHRDQLVFADHDIVGNRVDDVRAADAALNRVGQADFDLLATVNHPLGDALRGAAVVQGDDDVLGHVGQFAGQIARVGRLQRRVGQALAGAVRGTEVFQHGQALAEVRLDRRFDDLARGLRHQTAHAGQLANLLDAAAGAGVGHQEDRIHVPARPLASLAAHVVLQLLHHFRGNLFAGVRPGVEHLVVALPLGDDAALVALHELHHHLFGVGDDLRLVRRRDQVVGGEAQAGERALAEAHAVERVQQINRLSPAQELVAVGNHAGQVARTQRRVVVGHSGGQGRVEQRAADGGLHLSAGLHAAVPLHPPPLRQPHRDRCVRVHLAQRVGKLYLVDRGEVHPVPLARLQRGGHVVAAHHYVLRRADDRRAVGRAENVVRRHQQRVRLDLRLDRQRQMDGHLVAVEVGVEALAHQRVQLDRVSLDQHRLERLDAHAVQRRGAIEHHRMVLDHLFENVPNLLVLPFQHLLRRLDRVGVAELLQAADDERLVEFQGDFLGQAALVQPQRRADDDHAAGGIVHALAQQVLAESPLFPLDHVGQRFQRAVAAAQHRTLAAVVVEQGVDRLLQHPLLVADNHFRRVQIDQLLQPVVAVDDAAVQVVQVAGGKIARVQQDQRAQVGWNHRDHVQHHPLRPVVAVADRLDDLQPVDQVLLLLLRVGLDQLDAQVGRELD